MLKGLLKLKNSLLSRHSDYMLSFAQNKMVTIYNKLNSNIPDYNPFKIKSLKKICVDFPKGALNFGRICQQGLKHNHKIKIIRLKYFNKGELKLHTHYGYYEYIYIEKGVFINNNGKILVSGDNLIFDGWLKHNLKCLSESGSIIVAYSKKRKILNFNKIRKYILK